MPMARDPRALFSSRNLLLLATAIAVALVTLLVFAWIQRQALLREGQMRVDSVTAPVFLLDREFLRTTQSLQLLLEAPQPDRLDEARLRTDILLSKLGVVEESPGTAVLLQLPEHRFTVTQMRQLAERAEALLRSSPPARAELAALIGAMRDFSTDTQALSNAADGLVSRLLERQNSARLAQNLQTMGLIVGLIVLLLLAGIGLLWRQREQAQEERALKALNEELRQAQQNAESASQGKSLFLANMSHELRTPLNGVLGPLKLLQDADLPAAQADLVQTAHQSAQHLLSLFNDILDISSLDAGTITLQPEPVDIAALLGDVADAMRDMAEHKGLRFQVSSRLSEPQWLLLDGTRLRQILFNLLNNAIKFTDSGSVELLASADDSRSDGPWLSVQVRDTGIGMDEATQARVFQRFFQGDASLSRAFAGVGLGLDISQTLARRMGGAITLQSRPGQGSTFELRLPLRPCAAPDLGAAAATAASAAEAAAPARALRILVAEDHPVNQKFLELLLHKMGHQSRICDNGSTALEALQQSAFDVVLMDIHMPVMDGLSATRAIRALPDERARTPIVALTADVLPQARAQALSAGVDAFLNKPVNADDLRDVLSWLPRPAPG